MNPDNFTKIFVEPRFIADFTEITRPREGSPGIFLCPSTFTLVQVRLESRGFPTCRREKTFNGWHEILVSNDPTTFEAVGDIDDSDEVIFVEPNLWNDEREFVEALLDALSICGWVERRPVSQNGKTFIPFVTVHS